MCLDFTRRPSMENALGFSFGFTTFGPSAVVFGGIAVNWNHRFRPDNSGLIPRLRSVSRDHRSKPPFMDRCFLSGLILRLWWAVSAPSNETAKVPMFSRDLDSRVTFYGLAAEWNRRSAISKGKLVFSHAQFLMPINITLSHYLNKFFNA